MPLQCAAPIDTIVCCSVLRTGTQTRAKMSGLILSLDRSINPDPTIMLAPLIKISPVYDPWPTVSNAPAAGLPTRDLRARKQVEADQ